MAPTREQAAELKFKLDERLKGRPFSTVLRLHGEGWGVQISGPLGKFGKERRAARGIVKRVVDRHPVRVFVSPMQHCSILAQSANSRPQP